MLLLLHNYAINIYISFKFDCENMCWTHSKFSFNSHLDRAKLDDQLSIPIQKKRHKMEHSENLNSNKILHNFQFQKVNVYDNSSRYRFHHVFLLYHSTLLLFFYYFGITDLCVCIHKRTVRTLTHKISFKFYSLKSTMLNVNKLFRRKISLCF